MREPPVWCHDLTLPPEPSSPSRARGFVDQQLSDHDLTHLVDDVRLVVSELVTNAVVHARTGIKVSVAELPTWLEVTVFDDCPDRALPVDARRADDDADGGRGLWITEVCAWAWGTDRGHEWKSVWALFRLHPGAPGDERSSTGLGRGVPPDRL